MEDQAVSLEIEHACQRFRGQVGDEIVLAAAGDLHEDDTAEREGRSRHEQREVAQARASVVVSRQPWVRASWMKSRRVGVRRRISCGSARVAAAAARAMSANGARAIAVVAAALLGGLLGRLLV